MVRPQSAVQHPGNIFHQQEQVMGVGRTGLEVEMLVERRGLLVLGMDEQGPYSGDVRRRRAPA